MTNSRTPLCLLAATLFALTLSACSRGHPSMSKMEDRSNKMWDRIGTELGTAAAAQKPSHILLVRQENNVEANLGPGQDRMEAAFKKTIGSRPEVVTVVLPAIAPPANPTADHVVDLYQRLAPTTVTDALVKNGAASLLVSLLGEPTCPPPAGTKWPPLVCYSRDGSTNLANLIKSGIVLTAVAPRHTAPAKDEKDWFDLRYTVLNKDTIATW